MSAASDVDICFMAEVGAAITSGAAETRPQSQDPAATAAHDVHAGRPVPITAPQTPETASSSQPSPTSITTGAALESRGRDFISNEAWQRSLPVTHSQSLVGQAAGFGADVAVTSICVAAGALGGASAGENLGGDMAVSAIGPVAEPLGQAVGRNVGRVVGGATGATAIRCPSRMRSSRSPSSVRFAPDVPFQQ